MIRRQDQILPFRFVRTEGVCRWHIPNLSPNLWQTVQPMLRKRSK